MEEVAFSRGERRNRRIWITFLILVVSLLVLFFLSLYLGTTNVPFEKVLPALFGQGKSVHVRLIQKARLPRALGAVLVGGGLGLSGLLMQTCLHNEIASPGTLGVSQAAVLGANIAILILEPSGSQFVAVAASPFPVSALAFAFSALCILIVLGISMVGRFRPGEVVLAGIALGSCFQAASTLMQFLSDDIQLSAVVRWSFGDLERINYQEIIILASVLMACFVFFFLFARRYNALLGGEGFAKSLGVKTGILRLGTLFLASLIASLCVAFAGIIGFIGIVGPALMKRILGKDHRLSLPSSLLAGSVLLLLSDLLTRLLGNGMSLPVGAITAILGTPFFLFVLFAGRRKAA